MVDEDVRIGERRDRLSLDEGTAILNWPSELSPESFLDFAVWLGQIYRRAKRLSKVEDVRFIFEPCPHCSAQSCADERRGRELREKEQSNETQRADS